MSHTELARLAGADEWLPRRARHLGLLQPVAHLPRRQGGSLTLHPRSDVLLLCVVALLHDAGASVTDAAPLVHRLRALDGTARRRFLRNAVAVRWPGTDRWDSYITRDEVPPIEGAQVVELRGAL